MKTLKALLQGRKLSQVTYSFSILYILVFLLLGVKVGPAIASFSTIPVLLFGWTFGLQAGLVAGLVILPVNTLLFNLIGFPGWDVVFRVGGGPGSLMLIIMGAATGRMHDLTQQLAHQISAFQSAQEMLKTSEQNYRDLFEGIPIGIYRAGPDGRILAANAAMLELLGYPGEEDLSSKSALHAYYNPEERMRWQEAIEAQGVVRHFEVQLQRRDGSTLWVEDNAQMVRDQEDNCLYYEGSLIDIDKRKKAEELLLESETKYRDLINHIPQKVFYKNLDLVYVKVNPSFASDYQLTPEELIGKTDYDLSSPEIAEKYRNRDRQVIETGLPEELDEEIVRNGSYQINHAIKVPVWDQQGQIEGILGIFWDITERKRIETELLASQAQLSNAARIAHLGPWEYDVASDQFTFNDQFYSLFRTTAEREGGYTMSSAQYALRFVHPEDAPVVGEEIRKVLGTSDPHYSRELEHRIRYADGEMGNISVRLFVVKDEAGRTVKAFGANQDITEQKRAEAVREELLAENRRQKELLQRIVQETPAGIAFLEGAQYRYTLANPGYLEFTHGKGEILGRTVAEVWPEAYDALRPLLDHVYETGETFHAVDMPFTMIRDNGPETAYFTFTYTPLLSAQGKVESLLVTAQETTGQIEARQQLEKELSERKRMEAELLENERRYQGLFEDSPVSLWEEDFSEVKAYLEEIKRAGISDLSGYLDEHPDLVRSCLSRVRVLDVNQETLNMYRARSKAELLANFERVFSPESASIFREELLAIIRGQRVFEGEGSNSTLAGETIDIYLRWSVAPGSEETLSRVFVSILDITARKRAEERVQKQIEQADALAGIASALSAASLDAASIYAIIATQTASLIGDACLLTLISEDREQVELAAFHHTDSKMIPLMREMFQRQLNWLEGGSTSHVLRTGKPLIIPKLQKNELVPIAEPGYQVYLDHCEVDSLMILPLIAQGHMIGTLGVLRDHPGATYTLEDLSLLRYLANQAALPILNARLHDLIRQQALTDPLTGVPNRRRFFDIAEYEFRRAERYGHDLAVIMLDIDHFKNINNAYGHEVGDQMLQLVTRQCRSTLRSADLIGRYGGDEFLILLPETNSRGAGYIAERLRKSIEECCLVLGGNSIQVTVSMGVANKTQAIPDINHLLHVADEAMYIAKREGRNRVSR